MPDFCQWKMARRGAGGVIESESMDWAKGPRQASPRQATEERSRGLGKNADRAPTGRDNGHVEFRNLSRPVGAVLFPRKPRAALLRRLTWAGLFQAVGLSSAGLDFNRIPRLMAHAAMLAIATALA